MNHVFTACLTILLAINQDQSELLDAPVEGLKLGDPLTDFSESVYLLTGDEELYQQYDWLKESLLKNIENGIREGLYTGSGLDIIAGKRASKMTLFFYKEELYKVRWSFDKIGYSDPQKAGKELDTVLVDKYGPTTDEQPYGPYVLRIWKGDTYYMQSLGDEDEYQIEYRNELVHQEVEALE